MNPPQMSGGNLALRFGLEIGALVGLGGAAWTMTNGPLRWVAAIGVPLAAATLWGVFNVLDDPSRSGEAPVEIAGWVRLSIEGLVLGAGAIALGYWAGTMSGFVFFVVTLLHYGLSKSRIQWLVSV